MATVNTDEGVTTFTAHELRYILASADNESAKESRRRLALSDHPDEALILAAGLESLYVRDMVSVTDATMELTEAAAVVGYVLTSGADWFELAFVTDELIDACWLIRYEEAILLFSPRRLGTFEMRILREDPDADWLSNLVLGFLRDHEPAAVYSTHETSATKSGLAVRKLAGGTIEVSDESETVVVSGQIAVVGQEVQDQLMRFFDPSVRA
jgi:hypothetical protein